MSLAVHRCYKESTSYKALPTGKHIHDLPFYNQFICMINHSQDCDDKFLPELENELHILYYKKGKPLIAHKLYYQSTVLDIIRCSLHIPP